MVLPQIQVIFTEPLIVLLFPLRLLVLIVSLLIVGIVSVLLFLSVLYKWCVYYKFVHSLISMSIPVLQTKQCPSAVAKSGWS